MKANRLPEFGIAISILGMLIIPFIMPDTELKKKELAALNGINIKDQITLRRNYFFGHKEMSDIITGMSVLANTVDAFANSKLPGFENSKARMRFENSLNDAKFLSQFSIGMNDIYIIPALFLMFEESNPPKAMEIVRLGLRDSRTDGRLPLLGAFINHVFLRDLPEAGKYYKMVYEKNKQAAWMNDLANKLLAADDPYVTNPKLKNRLKKLVTEVFPKSKKYLQENGQEFEKGGNP